MTITSKQETGRTMSIYPFEADIMNNGINGRVNQAAARTGLLYELVEEKPTPKVEEQAPKPTPVKPATKAK